MSDVLPIFVINNSCKPVVVPRKTVIGEIEADPELVSISSVSTGVESDGSSSLNEPATDFDSHFNFENLSTEESSKLKELLNDFHDVFSKSNTDLGRTIVIRHKIDTQSHVPIHQRPYRVPVSQKPVIKKHIDDMLKADLIEPSMSPWCAPVVLVKKKSGETRFCCDYRKLNSITKKTAFPLPLIEETLTILHSKRYFTILDCCSGYHQVPMAPEDAEKTAFAVENRLYQWKVMAFGLTGAPGTFAQLMQFVLGDLLPDKVQVFLDDIRVLGATLDEQLANLRAVLERLRVAGLKLKPSKCKFLQRRVEFLGHIVSENGIEPDESKVEKIKTFPIPRNVSEVRSWISLCGYYRKFVPGFAAIAHPLTQLTKKDAKFEWSIDCQTAFEELKNRLITAPILAYPDFSLPFLIFTDASNFAVGAILSQIQNGKEVVIAYASKQLEKAQLNYSTIEKEAFAIIFATKQFHCYIYNHPVNIVSDHAPLRYLMEMKDSSNPRLARWSLALQSLDLKIEYRPGKVHRNADVMSRIPIGALTAVVFENPPDVTGEQRKDPYCSEIIKFLENKELPPGRSEPSWLKNVNNYSINEDNILQMKSTGLDRREEERLLLVLPLSMREWVLQDMHDDPLGGAHLGYEKTYDRIRKKFYWPRMMSEIQQYCYACESCAKSKTSPHMKKAPLSPDTIPSRPFERVAIDILGPLKETYHGNKYVLVVTCAFSRYPEAIALPDQQSPTVAKAFVEQVICRHGMPKEVMSDRGTNFCSALFQQVNEILKIKRKLTSAYHPMANGGAENLVKNLKNMLIHYVNYYHNDWDSMIPFVLFAYRNSINSSTLETPFYLLHGRDPELPLDVLLKNPSNRASESDDYKTQMICKLQSAFQLAKNNLTESRARQKRQFDKRAALKKFEIGDKVYVTTVVVKPEQSAKFTKKFHGPYRIVDKISNVLYKLDFKDSKAHPLIHVNRLKPCFEADLWKDEDNVEPLELRIVPKIKSKNVMESTKISLNPYAEPEGRPPTPVPVASQHEPLSGDPDWPSGRESECSDPVTTTGERLDSPRAAEHADPTESRVRTDSRQVNRRYNLRNRSGCRRPDFYGTVVEEFEELD